MNFHSRKVFLCEGPLRPFDHKIQVELRLLYSQVEMYRHNHVPCLKVLGRDI